MPSDRLTVTASVTRTELALAPLSLEVPNVYSLIRESVGPGSVGWRRQTATSPYVHGEVLVGAVKSLVMMPLGVRVYAVSMSTLTQRISDLIRAFEQFTYDLTVTIDGSTWTWRCQPADSSVGGDGQFQDHHLRALQQEVRFNIPRHPTPVAGPT